MKRLLASSRRQEGYKKRRSMKKSTIIIIVVIALLAIWGVTGYNGLVTMDENVSGQWSNVETQYQRRADLIPNLVNTVKGYASHEKETLEGCGGSPQQSHSNDHRRQRPDTGKTG